MIARILLLISFAVFGAGGCSFIDLTTGGEKVRVLAIDEVVSCRKLGALSSSVLEKLGFVPLPEDSVEENLYTEARNAAADMGGDTIVAATTLVDGKQKFHVYKCVDPNN